MLIDTGNRLATVCRHFEKIYVSQQRSKMENREWCQYAQKTDFLYP